MIDRSTKSHQYYYYTCSRIYKQDKEACNARAISKEKLERLVIEKLQSKVLTDSNLEELAPKIKELKRCHDELNRSRIQMEADMVAQSVEEVAINMVKSYISDLKSFLEESAIT